MGPDGALWFPLNHADAIGRIDTALLVIETGAGRLGRITPDGAVTHHRLPDSASRPHGICSGPDSRRWFTEWTGNALGSVDAEGRIRRYELPVPGSEPHGIAVGPDGALRAALEAGSLARLAPPQA